MRSLVQIYALAVCFASMMCLMVVLGIGLYDLVQIALPEFTLAHHQSYESNDGYLLYYPDKQGLAEDELTRLRDQGPRQAVAAERRSAAQSGVFVLIVSLIDLAVFAAHWTLANKQNDGQLPVHHRQQAGDAMSPSS